MLDWGLNSELTETANVLGAEAGAVTVINSVTSDVGIGNDTRSDPSEVGITTDGRTAEGEKLEAETRSEVLETPSW
jgi:hypothetical protein